MENLNKKNYEHQWKWKENTDHCNHTMQQTSNWLAADRNFWTSSNLEIYLQELIPEVTFKVKRQQTGIYMISIVNFHFTYEKKRLALSVKGSLPNGGSVSRYSNIGRVDGECISASSLWKPPSNRHVASREPLNRSTSVSLLPSLLVSIDSPSLSSQGCLK